MKTALVGFVLFAGILALLFLGALPKLQRHTALASEAKSVDTGEPLVNTVTLKATGSTSEITLPGSMQAIQEAPIYARIDGYLRRRVVDIGDRVSAGALMAEIEAPEIDQQLAQANANVAHAVAAVAQSKAALKQADFRMQLAKVTLNRWKQLVEKGVISKQDGDEKQGAYDAAMADVEAAASNVKAVEADVEAQQANVKRIAEMHSFERVTAPFEGVVTARNVDAGALISAGSASDRRELFRLAKTDELRIFVSVPQVYSVSIHPGETAVIRVGEFPGRGFPGKIVRTADTLDPSSRTLLTEIHIPNTQRVLRPGMFASVKFSIERTNALIVAPAGVMLFQGDGPHVVLVGDDNRLHFAKVAPGRDYGATIELISGVKEGDRAVLNPGDDLRDGEKVQVAGKE